MLSLGTQQESRVALLERNLMITSFSLLPRPLILTISVFLVVVLISKQLNPHHSFLLWESLEIWMFHFKPWIIFKAKFSPKRRHNDCSQSEFCTLKFHSTAWHGRVVRPNLCYTKSSLRVQVLEGIRTFQLYSYFSAGGPEGERSVNSVNFQKNIWKRIWWHFQRVINEESITIIAIIIVISSTL